MPRHSLSQQRRRLGASSKGSASGQQWEHHCGAAAAIGSLGAIVISFQEQITFPAAKGMLGLNKNGNSQQIELGTGKEVVASSCKASPVPAGSMVVMKEAEGCTEG